jgi:putative hemolysin
MVGRVFRLGDRKISSIITPRTEVIWLDIDDSAHEHQAKILESQHTRFPVGKGDLDHIFGIVHTKELLGRCLRGEELKIVDAMDEPVFVPESTAALQVLAMFRETRHQMVMVIDEFGGFLGLVTINDLMQAVVGDLPIQGAPIEQGITQRSDGSWLIDGLVPVDELMDSLGISELPDEDKVNFQTVGGFVMTILGRIPSAGDYFELKGLRFEVVDMDGMRIDKVLVSKANDDQIIEKNQD